MMDDPLRAETGGSGVEADRPPTGTDELRARTDELRRAAGRLADGGARLARSLADGPDLLVPAPDWSAGRELAGLEAALRAWFVRAGDRLTGTAAAIRAAADGYDAADLRAARRLAEVPR